MILRNGAGAPSEGEAALMIHLRACGLSGWWREWQFHPRRRWRFDFAFPDDLLAVEVEGGTWTNGRHSRGAGFAADCEKYAMAAILGWRVIRVTTDQVRAGKAAEWIMQALKHAPPRHRKAPGIDADGLTYATLRALPKNAPKRL